MISCMVVLERRAKTVHLSGCDSRMATKRVEHEWRVHSHPEVMTSGLMSVPLCISGETKALANAARQLYTTEQLNN